MTLTVGACRSALLGRLCSRSNRLKIAHDLPALRFRELGPNRHSAAHYSVGEDPEKRAGRGLLHLLGEQTRGLTAPFRSFAMAFGTVQLKKLGPRSYGLGISFQRIAPSLRFLSCLRQVIVNGIVFLFARRGMAWRAQRQRLAAPKTTRRPSPSYSLSLFATSEQPADCCAEAGELPGDAPAQQETVAVVIQAETWRQAQGPVRRKVPRHDGREVARRFMQAEAVAVSETVKRWRRSYLCGVPGYGRPGPASVASRRTSPRRPS